MNKKQMRQERLERHYEALKRLCEIEGQPIVDGKKLSVKLLKIEREAHQASEDYCNGIIDSDKHDAIIDTIEKRVDLALGFTPAGFFVNSDPRGCSLKINDDVMRDLYVNAGLERDWGGYGLLSPDIQ